MWRWESWTTSGPHAPVSNQTALRTPLPLNDGHNACDHEGNGPNAPKRLQVIVSRALGLIVHFLHSESPTAGRYLPLQLVPNTITKNRGTDRR